MADPSERFGELLDCGCEQAQGTWFYCPEHQPRAPKVPEGRAAGVLPEQLFTAGPLRDAARAGWHAARGEGDLAEVCRQAAWAPAAGGTVSATRVTRLEVIDHRPETPSRGRAFVAWNVHVELSYQDDGRTLKVFVTAPPLEAP